jgi:hypothetical protein
MHGDDERVPVAALAWGAELLYRTLAGVAVDCPSVDSLRRDGSGSTSTTGARGAASAP